MRIGIDARFYGSVGKGLGRYTQKLIENLEKIDKRNQYFIFLRKDNFDNYHPRAKNFQKILADYRWYSFGEQFFFPIFLKKFHLDLVHFTHFNVPIFYPGKFVVTIHDLILVYFPTSENSTLPKIFYKLKFLAYKIVINASLRRSQKIFTVSHFTKKDILKNYSWVDSAKIFVTYEACDDFCRIAPKKDDEDILSGYGIMKPYVLYVGNAYPHKNLKRLVLAFSKIKDKDKRLSLVLVGKMDHFYRATKKFVSEKKVSGVVFAGYVPDCELDRIFLNSLAYVFPSLYEGFGLPPLEAMAKGVPVVASDHACIREILGDSACYFDARDIDGIKNAVCKVLDNKNLRRNLIRKGYARATRYSWRRMAHETLRIYEGLSK